MRTRMIQRAAVLLLLLSSIAALSCGKEEDGSGAECESKARAYTDFVAANRACASDAECAIVGDCDRNSDFTAVMASAAAEAYQLAKARCDGASDGYVFRAHCQAGQCTRERIEGECCGCVSDAGL